jgi:hypothetical protein
MASGKTSKAVRNARSAVVTQRTVPWGGIIAGAVIVIFAAAVFGYVFLQSQSKNSREDALAPFTPTAANPDPSTKIAGIVIKQFPGGLHVLPSDQVAYTSSPPFGGSHDENWAACNGVVYPNAVRTETLVHSLEHGAVWIAYNPDQISGDALSTLSAKVSGQPYTVMSPYPGLDQPISLQSWGHQLKLSDAGDIRIDQFIQALRRNANTHPEPGASCLARGPGLFDQDHPPPFAPAPPVDQVGRPGIKAENAVPSGAAGAPSSVPGQ